MPKNIKMMEQESYVISKNYVINSVKKKNIEKLYH